MVFFFATRFAGNRTNFLNGLRLILKFPARLGGMSFLNPSEEATNELENSRSPTAQLTDAIFLQQQTLQFDECAQEAAIKDLKRRKGQRWKDMQD